MFLSLHPTDLHNLAGSRLLKEERKELYLHILIRSLAVSLLTFFVPVYLLKIGFSLSQTIIYLLLNWGTFGLFSPFAAKIVERFGIKEMLIARVPLLVFVLMAITLLEYNHSLIMLYIAAVLFGVTSSVYWVSVGDLFAKFVGKKHKGERTSKFLGFPRLAEILGPFIGGFIAFQFGWTSLFVIITFVLFLSIVPLFFLKGEMDHPKFSFSVFKHFKNYFREFRFLVAYGFRRHILAVLLPIVIFLNNINIFNLGILMSLVSLVNFLFTMKIGKITDGFGIRRVVRLGALSCMIISALMGYYVKSPLLMVLSVVLGFLTVLIDVPYETYLVVRSKQTKSPMDYVVFKEVSLSIGRVLLYVLVLILSYKFDVIFYLGSLASLIFVLF
ncbi:MAG: MFS transporter [Candidatus Nanoarchaeia archaeon]|nr:MFS transporter [Candidatus Nanoarchaeia archaeon]